MRKHSVDIILTLIMLPLVALWVLPLVLMISTSLKGQTQIFRPSELLPNPVLWTNYPKADLRLSAVPDLLQEQSDRLA